MRHEAHSNHESATVAKEGRVSRALYPFLVYCQRQVCASAQRTMLGLDTCTTPNSRTRGATEDEGFVITGSKEPMCGRVARIVLQRHGDPLARGERYRLGNPQIQQGITRRVLDLAPSLDGIEECIRLANQVRGLA